MMRSTAVCCPAGRPALLPPMPMAGKRYDLRDQCKQALRESCNREPAQVLSDNLRAGCLEWHKLTICAQFLPKAALFEFA